MNDGWFESRNRRLGEALDDRFHLGFIPIHYVNR